MHHRIPGPELPLWCPVGLRDCGRQQIGHVVGGRLGRCKAFLGKPIEALLGSC